MSAENLATDSRTFTKTPNPIVSPWIPGTVNTIIEVKSNDVKCNGKKVLLGPTLSWSMSGCTLASYTFGTGGGSMTPTCVNVKSNTLTPFREKDEGNCSGAFALTASPFTLLTCSCKIKIGSAGQTDVKAI